MRHFACEPVLKTKFFAKGEGDTPSPPHRPLRQGGHHRFTDSTKLPLWHYIKTEEICCREHQSICKAPRAYFWHKCYRGVILNNK